MLLSLISKKKVWLPLLRLWPRVSTAHFQTNHQKAATKSMVHE